jgi:hypothetical protein
MPDSKQTKSSVPVRESALAEEEVYGALGALMGTLEVVATDDDHPVPSVQGERLRSALGLCFALQQQIEALLILSSNDLEERLRRGTVRVRPLVEHAVRGARRAFETVGVTLTMPTGDDWGSESTRIDSSRVDRTIRALTELLATGVGRGGSIRAEVHKRGSLVELSLLGARAEQPSRPSPVALLPALPGAVLLSRAAARLFTLSGGAFSFDVERLAMHISLPVAEVP